MNSFKFQPYLGLEYQYQHISASKNYRSIMSADVQSANLFVGTRVNKRVGMEIGYYRSLYTAQQQNQIYSFNGSPAGAITQTLTRTSFKGFSIDWAGYYSLDPNFDASLIVGFATMHPSMTFKAAGGTTLAQAFTMLKSKNRTVPRAGLGLEILKKHWGLRSKILWVYTQRFKLDTSRARTVFPAITENPYVQALELTAGVFYRF